MNNIDNLIDKYEDANELIAPLHLLEASRLLADSEPDISNTLVLLSLSIFNKLQEKSANCLSTTMSLLE